MNNSTLSNTMKRANLNASHGAGYPPQHIPASNAGFATNQGPNFYTKPSLSKTVKSSGVPIAGTPQPVVPSPFGQGTLSKTHKY